MLPLQIGDFGPTTQSLALLTLVVAIVLAYWVYNDATGRSNDNAVIWALVVGLLTLFTLFGGLIAFAVYIWQR